MPTNVNQVNMTAINFNGEVGGGGGGGTGITNIVCSTAENTPQGVSWTSGGSTITGTLAASASTISNRYFVLAAKTKTKNTYKEYVTIQVGDAYQWEELGTVDLDLDDYLKAPAVAGTEGQVLKKTASGVEWANEAYPKDSLKNSFVRHDGSASLTGGVSIPTSSWFITWREGDGTSGPRYLDNALVATGQMRNINEYSGKLASTNIDYDYFYFDHTQLIGNQEDGSYLPVAGSEIRVYSDSAMTNAIGTIIQANHPSVNMYKGWGNNENYNDFIAVYPDQRCQFIPFANHASMKYVYCANEDLEPDPETDRPIVLCFGSPYGAYDRTFTPTTSSAYDVEFYYTSRPVSLQAFFFGADIIVR